MLKKLKKLLMGITLSNKSPYQALKPFPVRCWCWRKIRLAQMTSSLISSFRRPDLNRKIDERKQNVSLNNFYILMDRNDWYTFASETAGAIHSISVIAPVQIGDLEKSVIERAVRVERTYGWRVEITFPAHHANPCVRIKAKPATPTANKIIAKNRIYRKKRKDRIRRYKIKSLVRLILCRTKTLQPI